MLHLLPTRAITKLFNPGDRVTGNSAASIWWLSTPIDAGEATCEYHSHDGKQTVRVKAKLAPGEWRALTFDGLHAFAEVFRDGSGAMTGVEVSAAFPGEGMIKLPAEAVEEFLRQGQISRADKLVDLRRQA